MIDFHHAVLNMSASAVARQLKDLSQRQATTDFSSFGLALRHLLHQPCTEAHFLVLMAS